MSYRLNCVSVECDVLGFAYLTDLTDGLDRADLVICIHDRNKACILADRISNLRSGNKAVRMNVEIGYFVAFLFELSSRMKLCVMLESS